MSGIDSTSKKLLNISRPDIGKVEKEGELIGMLSKQLYLAGNQMQRMQVVLKKAEDRLKTKDVEIGRLKRKVEDHRMENYLGDGVNYPGHGYQLGKQSLSQIRQLTLSNQVKIIPKVKSSPDAKQSWNINNLNCSSRPSLSARDRPESHDGTYDLPKTSSARLIDFDLSNLRSQILASHNNNCSDSHLRSHMNAEFSLSTKTDKRIPIVPQSTECILPIKDQLPEKLSNNLQKKNKVCRINSIERTTFSTPVSRQSGTCNNRIRSRSASLTGNIIKPRSPLRLNTNDNSIVTSKNIKTSKNKNGKLRISKSMTLNKNKCELPLVREINSASDKFGELRLKVRSMNGSTVYLVHLTPDDTVARLYQLLDTALNFRKRPTVGYKILISGYSPKRLDHFGFTLRDYGISRDCVLHLVND